MDGHVFLSYRSCERAFSTKLALDLRQAGFPIWMDRLQGIAPGDDWVQTLQDALNDSTALIAVLSPAYVKSDYCRKELKRAVSLKRPVFPVLLKAVPAQEWPLEIQSGQYVDFQGWEDSATYSTRLQELIDEGLIAKLHVQPRPEVAASTPVPGAALPGRELDEQVAQTVQAAEQKPFLTGIAAMKRKALQSELELVFAQWQAAFDQRLMTTDLSNKPVLSKQLAHFEERIQSVENQLAATAPGAPSTRHSPE